MRILIIFIFGLFIGHDAFSQIAFYKIYTGNQGDEEAHGVLQMEDSSYMVTGLSSSFVGGVGSQVFLMNIDSLGNYKWSNHYGGSESEVGKRVVYKENYGFLIAGYTNSFGAGGYDFYLVKTDESGTEEWSKTYGGTGWERVHDAMMTRDTGMIMVGETSSNLTDNKDMYIVRTDKEGDTIWTKTIGSNLGEDVLNTIEQYNDSVFFAAGHTYHEDSSRYKPFLMKFHEDGTIYWVDTFLQNGNSTIKDIHLYQDELISVGNTDKNVPGFLFNYGIRLDVSTAVPTVILEWNEGSTGKRTMHQVTTYGDLGKRYIAFSYQDIWSNQDDGLRDVAVSRFSENFGWQQNLLTVTDLGAEDLNDLIRTSDGGAIAVGRTNGFNLGLRHAFVGKIGPNELLPDISHPFEVETLVSVEEQSFVSDVSIYPIPASDLLIVEMPMIDEVQLELLNSLGQTVWKGEVVNSTTINVTAIPSGLYWLKMTNTDGQSGVRKVAVQR